MEWLKAAREEAVDWRQRHGKSAIFQTYKDQINAYLNANGHDTVKPSRTGRLPTPTPIIRRRSERGLGLWIECAVVHWEISLGLARRAKVK